MIISIIVNTSKKSESFGFIKPLADIKSVEKIFVFGEGYLQEYDKVKYIIDDIKRPKILKLIFRFFNAIRKSKGVDYIIGIYEIPHGFIAFLTGLVLRKRTVLCIIGNPAYIKIRKGFRLWLMNLMIKKMNFTTITGNNSRNFLIKKGHNPKKLFILPNSIDVSNYKISTCDKKYDIINLGRLSPEKELIVLLKIVLELKKDYKNIRVGIAGSGEEYYQLNNFIKQNYLQDNVELLGFIDDKISFFQQGKIFVITSSTEGLPRSVIESMCCGIPCVVPNIGDISDLIQDYKNGFIINRYDDIKSYKDKINTLLNNDKLRNDLSQNAVKTIHEKYSHKAATVFWENLLNINIKIN
ncbi:MAG: glycosyltransferase family 4 protein [Candidatus Lokiarchaeota archaeon]|nr:glycosyltransferase family 4 protein [Candidatus Lokiarchaeota archaeon]